MRTFNPPNLTGVKELTYDTETTGLDWKKDKVCGYVLTWGPNPDESVYWPVRHMGGDNFDPAQVEAYIRHLAKNPEITWTGHHLKFDLHMSANHGIEFAGRLNCTQVNAALLDEEQGSFSLDTCAKIAKVYEKKGDALYEHLAKLFGGNAVRSQMANFWKLRADDPMAHEYAAGDGTSTFQLWQYQRGMIAHEKLELVHDVECRAIRTLFRMERKGVLIDMDQFIKVKNEVADRVEQAQKKLPKDFNERSPIQMKALMEAHGHTDWPMTKPSKKFPNGQPSFTEKFLEQHEIGKAIIRLRKYTNLQNSFIEGQISNHIHNGRIHTTFNQTKMDDYGTVTGRLSSSDPNLQQCPKRDKELAPLFRRIFIPDRGFEWKANDYKQQEFVVFAHYSGSKALAAGYNSEPPVDMHQFVAELCNVERDPTAKRLNLGKLYGMGVVKLAMSLGISVEEARALSRLWDNRVPEAKQYLKDAEVTAKARGFVRTILGRRRRFPNSEYAHKAGNSIIQGCSADITKLKMVEIDEHFARNGDSCQMLLQIHDELDWQVPVGECQDVHVEALRIMEDFGPTSLIPLDVRLRVDASSGKDWSEATFG